MILVADNISPFQRRTRDTWMSINNQNKFPALQFALCVFLMLTFQESRTIMMGPGHSILRRLIVTIEIFQARVASWLYTTQQLPATDSTSWGCYNCLFSKPVTVNIAAIRNFHIRIIYKSEYWQKYSDVVFAVVFVFIVDFFVVLIFFIHEWIKGTKYYKRLKSQDCFTIIF